MSCSPGARSRSRSQGEQSIETVPGSPYSMEAQERLRQALLRSSSGSSSRQAGSSGTTLPASRSASSQPAAVVNCVKISELTAQEKKQFIETGWVVRDNTAWEVQPESDTEAQVTQRNPVVQVDLFGAEHTAYSLDQKHIASQPQTTIGNKQTARIQVTDIRDARIGNRRDDLRPPDSWTETNCGLLTQTDSDQNTMASK